MTRTRAAHAGIRCSRSMGDGSSAQCMRRNRAPLGRPVRRWHRLMTSAMLALLAAFGACEGPTPPEPDLEEPDPIVLADSVPIVSNPVASSAVARLSLASFAPQVGDGDADVVYVSLRPGLVPNGQLVTIRRRGNANTITALMEDGGLNPVPIAAADGDTVDIDVQVPGAASVRFSLRVPITRRPRVVRTHPPPKKKDVALNTGIVIVFTEPVEGSSLTPTSVQLLRGGTAVAGTVRLLEGVTAAAVFEPSAPLDASTDYRLVISPMVRDLDGEALDETVTVEFTTGSTSLGSRAWSVSAIPDTTSLRIGSQVQLIAAARDTNGMPITGRPVVWTGLNPAVVTVTSTGLVSAVGLGEARVQAEVDFGVGEAVIRVESTLAPVTSVQVIPDTATIPVGGLLQMTAVLRDADGNEISFRPVTWSLSNSGVASLTGGSSSQTWITGVSPGTVTVTATSEGESGTASLRVVAVGRYLHLEAATSYTCATSTDDWAFCWGANGRGQLGNGTTGGSYPTPAAVGGGRKFAQVAAYMDRTCALTPDGDAFCWGFNDDGGLGIGSITDGSAIPLAVVGGLRFKSIGMGQHHVCGLTLDGTAYCWGTGAVLGDGETNQSSAPVAVAGGLTFSALTVGDSHACGLTAAGRAYCWGANWLGQLGDSTTVDRLAPVPVTGGLTFTALSAGYYHTCALAPGGTGYCWGLNSEGQLGTGSTTGPQACASFNWGDVACSTAPARVTGSLQWTVISAGGQIGHSCALTPTGRAYCWGTNSSGQLGTGTPTGPNECTLSDASCSPRPLPVAGTLAFTSVSAGAWHSCGLTTDALAYCWGGNGSGELGDGSTTDRAVPVRVTGQP